MPTCDQDLLRPLLGVDDGIRSEYRKRKKQFDSKSVHPKLVEEAESEGWSFDKRNKKTIRVKKAKPHDERLENKLWCLLHDFGYSVLNEGRNFKIKFARKKGGTLESKQVDVFAKDDETVIVAECKSSAELGKRSLQKDIEEFANLRKHFAESVRQHFGGEFKPKILWLFVTENIIWSKPDRERAENQNIQIITERELLYLRQLADHLHGAARYQFLAEYFAGQSIPELANKTVPAVRGRLGGVNFYSFVATAKDLLKISFINHRSLDDPEGMPTYQRLVQKSRIIKIGKFIEDGGYFPTNILVNFKEKPRFDVVRKEPRSNTHYGYLYLPDKYKSVWIIDGQHRLYGYAHLDEKLQSQTVLVIAFEKMPQVEEARLFVTINSEQKSVPANLLEELDGDLKWGSEKPNEIFSSTAARLIATLNTDLGGPIYGRVVTQGLKRTERLCLTVKGLKDGLRASGLIGRAAKGNKIYDRGPISGHSQASTLQRAAEFVTSYWSMVRESNYVRWDRGASGNLSTNVGLSGLVMLAGALFKYVEHRDHIDTKELSPQEALLEITPYLRPLLTFLKETAESELDDYLKVQFGSGGPKIYYYKLVDLINQGFPDFKPEGFNDWKTELSQEQKGTGDQRVKNIRAIIIAYLFARLNQEYGEYYFEKGVTEKKLKAKAYEQSLGDEVEERAPIENYLDILDYKKIAETPANWVLVQTVFRIVLPGGKKSGRNTSWMAKFNDARKRGEHSSYQRNYTEDDLLLLEFIERELYNNLQKAAEKDDAAAQKIVAGEFFASSQG